MALAHQQHPALAHQQHPVLAHSHGSAAAPPA
jgi:hypothetical protein